ncbi:MAG: hypothetical protein PHN32_05375 [Actinomycetota bacterium]|nr:hypothetical protein [Actinomycetota bacterium]
MVKYKKSSKHIRSWIIAITAWTFLLAILLSLISETLITNVALIPALIILVIIIAIGVLFDIVGVAVTAATEVPLNSMSAKKIKGAREAVELIKNADRVANFCNDVIGDITGIVSGSVGAVIVFRLMIDNPTLEKTLLSVVITGFIASLTVGGKALGKNIAIRNCKFIVLKTGYVVYLATYIFRRNKR